MAKKKSKPTEKLTPERPTVRRPTPSREHPATAKLKQLAELALQLHAMRTEQQDEAQAFLNAAYQSSDKGERRRLAKKALEVSPRCSDAYLLLADDAESRAENFQLCEKALEVAEQALGPAAFEQDAGNFWERLDTRSFMRAKERLARELWAISRREEAIQHFKELLRLNPQDHQGVRYTLANWMLNEGQDAELEQVLADFDEPDAASSYTKALLAFRKRGDTSEARKLLNTARKRNKFVPDYILDRKLLPGAAPPLYQLGSEDEAIIYAAGALSSWKATPGATEWLKSREPVKKRKKKQVALVQGPLPLVKQRLSRLPQVFDVWEVDCRQTGNRIEEDGALVNPWLMMVASASTGLILADNLSDEPPSAELAWDVLAKAMQQPLAEEPHRPTEIRIQSERVWDEVGRHLDDIGVRVSSHDELELLDYLFADFRATMNNDRPPGLLEIPGMSPELAAAFYHAAAHFYGRAPWRKLGFESAIRIATDRYESGPWYAVIMGQSGITFGLALYEDLEILQKLWAGTVTDEENTRETVALSLTFGEDIELSDADLDAIEEYDFEIAGRKAFPCIFRKERGLTMRPPLAWELELMEACLLAIPDFVDRYRPDDLSTHTVTASVASGPVRLTMAWIED